ncbi:MAG: helix-turn-helix domain-containing protein, partial [Planctomycetales bacterium]|nr:helix-turn-helix domain-containing protein [Planctomycetales bacterium]
MSTSAKTCPPKNVKKSKYKMASPISNDRAEAFVGPQAEVSPRFSEVPSEQDAKAFRLAAKGMTQREIAKELHTSQPTVQRGIKKYRLWFGSTLPEDRGELVGWQRFRVAVEEQRIFLRHQQELAMEEWQQSRQSVPMKRKRTKLDPEGQKVDGMPVKDIQVDEWVQHRRGCASHLNAAAKRSLELTMLEGGYLGVHKLSCDLAIDTDERDRWDRAVKSYQGTIEKLSRKVTDLVAKLGVMNSSRLHEAERNARVSDESPVENPPQGNANPACISQSLMHPTVAVNSS